MAKAHRPPAAKRAAFWTDWLLGGAIAAYLLANVPFLVAWPAVHGDEGREMNAFWVASRIDPSATGLDPVFRHDPLYKGGLQGLSTAISFRLFGFGLFQGRIVSLVWGGLLLWATFLAGRRLYGPVGAAIAVLLLAVSEPFLVSSHMVRPDIVVAALVMAALYSALRGLQQGGWIWHPAAGLLLGLGFDVHPNTVAFVPMVGLCYLLRYGRRAIRSREGWLFVGGLVLGAMYYAGVRIVPDPRQYAESFGYWVGVDKRPPIVAGGLWAAVQAELGRWGQYFGQNRLAELALLAIGAAAAAWRTVRDRDSHPLWRMDPLLGGLLVALAIFTVLVSSKTEFYLILFFPMLVLLAAAAIAQVGSTLGGSRLVASGLLVVLAVSAMGFEDNSEDVVEAASDVRDHDYGALSAQLQERIPPGSKVVAPPTYWIGLADPPYYVDFVDFSVWERVRRERNVSWPDFLRDIDPEYVILDSKARSDVTNRAGRFMEANADLVGQIKDWKPYGDIQVWRMRGDARPTGGGPR